MKELAADALCASKSCGTHWQVMLLLASRWGQSNTKGRKGLARLTVG